jgi:hypothetical protein
MHAGELFRLNESTVAIEPKVGWPMIDLPEGAIVTISNGSPDHRWFINVMWGQKALCMFKVDLWERATLVEEFASVGPEKVTTPTRRRRSPTTERLVTRGEQSEAQVSEKPFP